MPLRRLSASAFVWWGQTNTDTDYDKNTNLSVKYRFIGKIPIMDTDYSLYWLKSQFNRYRYQYRLLNLTDADTIRNI